MHLSSRHSAAHIDSNSTTSDAVSLGYDLAPCQNNTVWSKSGSCPDNFWQACRATHQLNKSSGLVFELSLIALITPVGLLINAALIFCLVQSKLYNRNLRLVMGHLSLSAALYAAATFFKSVSLLSQLSSHNRCGTVHMASTCQYFNFLTSTSLKTMIYSLLILAVERLYASIYYTTYDAKNDYRLLLTISGLTWIVASLLHFMPWHSNADNRCHLIGALYTVLHPCIIFSKNKHLRQYLRKRCLRRRWRQKIFPHPFMGPVVDQAHAHYRKNDDSCVIDINNGRLPHNNNNNNKKNSNNNNKNDKNRNKNNNNNGNLNDDKKVVSVDLELNIQTNATLVSSNGGLLNPKFRRDNQLFDINTDRHFHFLQIMWNSNV